MTEGYTLGARGHKNQRGGWRDHSETEESKNNSEQVFKIGERDGIVVTGTIPLEQIYNLIDDDIKTHTHKFLKNVQKSTLERLIFFYYRTENRRHNGKK